MTEMPHHATISSSSSATTSSTSAMCMATSTSSLSTSTIHSASQPAVAGTAPSAETATASSAGSRSFELDRSEAGAAMDQVVIKTEPSASLESMTTVTSPPPTATGKAQRAARRDVVNARRDKRKAMSMTSPSSTPVVTSAAATAAAAMVPMMMNAHEQVAKKMKPTPQPAAAIPTVPAAAPVTITITSGNHIPSTTAAPKARQNTGLVFTDIDPSGEERLRAMEAQLESLDPDSKEAKKKRRLIRNRMSAQLHRERKKAYVGQLEEQIQEKDQELKRLQEQLAAMANESSEMKKRLEALETSKVASVVKEAVPSKEQEAEEPVVIKEETVFVAPSPTATPTPLTSAPTQALASANNTNANSWENCFGQLDDSDLTDVEADELLKDFEHPFTSYGASATNCHSAHHKYHANHHHHHHQHTELHTAKFNIAMIMAVVLSVTFFGNTGSLMNLMSGSNFASMFGANPPKEFSQIGIASRIVAALENTSWRDFRDLASWASAKQKAPEEDAEEIAAPPAASSPSASSEAATDCSTTSSCCDSPASQNLDNCLSDFDHDFVEDFSSFDDPFAVDGFHDVLLDDADMDEPGSPDSSYSSSTDTIESMDFDGVEPEIKTEEGVEPLLSDLSSDLTALSNQSKIDSSRVFKQLTQLWQDKHQVILRITEGKKEIRRGVAEMSEVLENVQMGHLLHPECSKCLKSSSTREGSNSSLAMKSLELSGTQEVTFLYPMSAFAPEKRVVEDLASGEVFLEVSCRWNGASPAPIAIGSM